ncbi:hypothetical protein QIH36_27905, partial [Klebsiella pneumoniae]|nr:hypothetical protein [Klebsiella pneumoniae]
EQCNLLWATDDNSGQFEAFWPKQQHANLAGISHQPLPRSIVNIHVIGTLFLSRNMPFDVH